MKLASFQVNGRTSWGVVEGDEILDVGHVLGSRIPDLKALITQDALNEVEGAKAKAGRISLGAISWLPVIPNAEKILCVGLNYENHRQETGRAVVTNPTIFGRYANSQIGHLAKMIRPRVSTDLDYEGELAIVIKKGGRYISRSESWDYIAGYACYNDGSLRDFQWHTHQFTPGKNFPGTGSFGPWMMTPDELGPLDNLRLQTRLNGEVMQEATIGQMIFDIPTQIEYCSSFTRLEPGDVIVTGTPGGVGAKRKPPVWLKPGDQVEVEVDRLGILRNEVTDEA